MAKTKTQKEAQLKELKQNLEESSAVVFTDFTGLKVNDFNTLRSKVAEHGANIVIAKNTLIKKANENVDLQGQTAVIFAKEKTVEPIKALYAFIKEKDLPKVKLGILNNQVIDEAAVKQLSTLPSIDELRAKMLGSMMAPLSNFVGLGSNLMGSFVRVVNGIKEKKENQ